MASERYPIARLWVSRMWVRSLFGLGLELISACHSEPRFPLREAMQVDPDDQPFGPIPKEYVSPFAWDAADQSLFRPVARFLAVDPPTAALNVNALDEVPDSSWFVNRLGRVPMTPQQLVQGPCQKIGLNPNGPEGSWIIDQGKDNGFNPGFRVNIPGVGKFMLKADDPAEPERATGATAIATRIYHALGYYAPCDSVVYFRPSLLRLKPGLTVTNNQGVTSAFDRPRLDLMLSRASQRNGLIRMVASEWLPGKTLGPYKYSGLRADDPNDIIPHQNRRELRGARLVAAWLNHFDAREQNTMDVFMGDGQPSSGRGYVRHYIMDLGDCFGSVWSSDEISRRLGKSYLLDFSHLGEDFVLLGTRLRPWERARRLGGIFNYFSVQDFDPEAWRAEYPNPAFSRMTEADGAWMARLLAHFTDDLVKAAVSAGAYSKPDSRYLTETLIARRDAILRRYLSRLSPISDLRMEGDRLCGVDLARHRRLIPDEGQSYRAYSFRGSATRGTQFGKATRMDLAAREGGGFCVPLGSGAQGPSLGKAQDQGYVILAISNGYSRDPIWVHLYDLGSPRGYRLVGIERNRGPLPVPRELTP